MAWAVRMAWPMRPRHTGNPGRSARVKVDPGRLVGDLDRSECDMLHDSQWKIEYRESQAQNCGTDHQHGMFGMGTKCKKIKMKKKTKKTKTGVIKSQRKIEATARYKFTPRYIQIETTVQELTGRRILAIHCVQVRPRKEKTL